MLAFERNSRFSLMRQRIWQQGRGSKRFRDTGLQEFDFMDFLSQRRNENNTIETVDVESLEETRKKVKKLKRDNSGYDPRNARESPWFKIYVGEQSDL
jgi:type IV secretory pathway VirD2 relaxase